MKKDEVERRIEDVERGVADLTGDSRDFKYIGQQVCERLEGVERELTVLSRRPGALEEWRRPRDGQKACAVGKVGELLDRVDQLERRLEIVERRGEPEAHCTKDWATCEHGIGVCGARRCDKDGLLCPWPKKPGEQDRGPTVTETKQAIRLDHWRENAKRWARWLGSLTDLQTDVVHALGCPRCFSECKNAVYGSFRACAWTGGGCPYDTKRK